MSSTTSAPPDVTSFEECIRRLGDIVQTLERGDLPLEESLRLFEEGVRLARASQTRLDSAQKKVEELLSVTAAGNTTTAPFELRGDESPDSA